MALNIFEELDLTSSGDNVDEGFLKCKNNWAELDILLPGYLQRSKFTYVDGDTITVGAGVYSVNGVFCKIAADITTDAHGVTGADWAYLYIDYSSIPSDGALLQSDLVWSTTEPTWDDDLLGWYSGNDRCIFSCYIAVTSNDIREFVHVGNLVQYAAFSSDVGGQLTTTYAASALTVPALGAMKVPVTFNAIYADGTAALYYAPADVAVPGTTNNAVVRCDADDTGGFNTVDVITDSSQQIQLKESAATTNTYYARTMGWYFPEGM